MAKIVPNVDALDNAETLSLAKLLGNFNQIVLDAATKYEPSILAKYLIDVAQAFNRFYIAHRVIGEDIATTKARIGVVTATKTVLANGLNLLGIQAPEQM